MMEIFRLFDNPGSLSSSSSEIPQHVNAPIRMFSSWKEFMVLHWFALINSDINYVQKSKQSAAKEVKSCILSHNWSIAAWIWRAWQVDAFTLCLWKNFLPIAYMRQMYGSDDSLSMWTESEESRQGNLYSRMWGLSCATASGLSASWLYHWRNHSVHCFLPSTKKASITSLNH